MANKFIEQSLHSVHGKVKTIRDQLDASLAQTQELRSKLAELQTSRTSLEKELATQKLSSTTTDDEINTVRNKLESVIAEKDKILARFEKKDAETKELQNELENARKANVSSRKSIIELESQIQLQRSSQISTKVKEQNYEQEIELLKKSNDWYKTELENKSNDMNTFKSEKLGLISALQSELATIQSTHHSLEKSHASLKEQYEAITKKLDDSLVRVNELQISQTTNEEGFRVEMESQKKLVALWEKSAQDAKKRVQELETTVESERTKYQRDISGLRKETETLKAKIAKLENRTPDEAVADENNRLSTPGVPRTPLGKGTPNLSGIFSPSAHVISEIQKGGSSLSQLYSDFQECKTRLEREKFKNQNLREQMNEILSEMENQAPAIVAERQENERLEQELTEMSEQLETVTSIAEEAQSHVKSFRIKAGDAQRESQLLGKLVTDLSRQVQHLLVQNQLSNDTDSDLTPDENAALQKILKGEGIDESEGDHAISERLVLFKDAIDLQKQNQHLLEVSRGLNQKFEKIEQEAKERLDAAETLAVSEARGTVESLQLEIGSLQTKIEALQRERDMFRRILSGKRNDNGVPMDQVVDASAEAAATSQVLQLSKEKSELAQSYKEMEAEYESYKTETNVTLKTLDAQIVTLSNERSNLQVQLAKTESHLELTSERFKNLESNFQTLRVENDDFRKRATVLQEALSQQELRSQRLSEEILSANSALETSRSESANLKAEKTLWKSIEDRLKQEIADLIEGRDRLNGLLANAQLVEAEAASVATEAQKRLNTQLSSFEDELSSLRASLGEREEQLKAANEARETQIKSFQERNDKLSNELHTAHESLVKTKDEEHKLELKCKELESELQTAKERVSLLEKAQLASTDNDELATLKKKFQSTTASLSETQTLLSKTQTDLASAEKTISDLLEQQVASKDGLESALKAKENELLNAQDQFNAAKDLLTSSQEELASFRAESAQKVESLVAEEKKLKNLLKVSEEHEAQLRESISAMKSDFSRQETIAKEAQENYEREVVKHAEATRVLQEIRADHEGMKKQLAEVSAKAEAASAQLANSEASWQEQKTSYESQLEVLNTRYAEASEQNKILLDQLEASSSQIANRTENPPTYAESSKSTEQLHEIINHLKREKDIVDTKFDLNVQEIKRLSHKLEQTVSALDDAKAQLELERQKNGANGDSTSDQKKIEEQLNDIAILKESNTALRQQSSAFSQKIKDLEGAIDEQKSKIEPLEEKLGESEAEVKTKEEQIKELQQDCDKWKDRAQQILQKYERIDPEELKALRDQVEALTNQKLESDTKLAESTSELESKLGDIEALKTKLAEVEAASATHAANHEAVEARFNRLKNESVEKLGKRRAEVKELREQIASLTQSNETLTTELENAKSLGSAQESLQQRVSELEEANTSLTTQLEDAKAQSGKATEEAQASTENSEKALSELQSSLDESNKTIEALSASLESEKASFALLTQERDNLAAQVTALSQNSTESSSDGVNAVDKQEIEKLMAQKTELENKLSELSHTVDEVTMVSNDYKARLELLEGQQDSQVIEQLENDKKALQDEVNKLKESAENSAGPIQSDTSIEVNQLKAQIEQQEKLIADFQTQLDENLLAGHISELESSNNELQSKLTALEEKLKNSQAASKDGVEVNENGITEEDVQQRLMALKQELENAHSVALTEAVSAANTESEQKLANFDKQLEEAKEKVKQEVQAEHEARFAEIKTHTMKKLRDTVAQRTENIKAQLQEEFDAKAAELQKAGSTSVNIDEIKAQLQEEFQEEKKKAVEHAKETTQRSLDMRLKLVTMKADKAEKEKQELQAQLASLQGTAPAPVSSPAPAGGAPTPAPAPAQPRPTSAQPSAIPASGLPVLGSGIPRRLPASGIPRPGLPRPVTSIPRPTIPTTAAARNSKIPTPGAGVAKRQMDADQAAGQAQPEAKKRKGGEEGGDDASGEGQQ